MLLLQFPQNKLRCNKCSGDDVCLLDDLNFYVCLECGNIQYPHPNTTN